MLENTAGMDASELWRALTSGCVSVAECSDGAGRHYRVVDNPPDARALRALTQGELEAVSYTTRGLPAKLVAHTLGRSATTVSSRLARAAAKIGVRSRTELVRIAALLTREQQVGASTAELTKAERDVLNLLAQGLSNRQIAAVRQRSLHTIANQVASLLRKTRSPSRRALAARA